MYYVAISLIRSVFFFTDTATTEIYTLSLHDALPILERNRTVAGVARSCSMRGSPYLRSSTLTPHQMCRASPARSEEHTSELQSRVDLVCRLLLEKKKENITNIYVVIQSCP